MNGTNIMTVYGDVFTEKGNAYKWLWHKQIVDRHYHIRYIGSELGPIPYNLTVYKSAESVNSAMSRDFVKFIVTDKRALALRERLEYVNAAEEFFFATLNKMEDAPGNHHTLKKNVKMPIVSRAFWNIYPKKTECIERYFIHSICILSVSDLPYLKSVPNTWFFNKYRIDYVM